MRKKYEKKDNEILHPNRSAFLFFNMRKYQLKRIQIPYFIKF